MCHNQFALLEKIISNLDDEWNDIYIHIDKKSNVPKNLVDNIKKANVIFIKRKKISWGGYSQIETELRLLEESTKVRHKYYHLISGVDFPLKTSKEIKDFFDYNQGKEYISFDFKSIEKQDYLDRIKYFYFFQDLIGRNKGTHIAIYEKLETLSLKLQRRFHINRLKNITFKIYKGANWFSITEDMAKYIIKQKRLIRKVFRYCHCGDELFLQTMAMISPYKDNIVFDNMRYIDWERGSPYTFTKDDFDVLIQSNKLWARKFDYEKYPEIIDMLVEI